MSIITKIDSIIHYQLNNNIGRYSIRTKKFDLYL